MELSEWGRRTVDVFETIKSDHDKVEKLLGQMQQTSTEAARKREQLLNNLGMDLLPHACAEEQWSYRA